MNVNIDQLPPPLRDIVLQNNPLVRLAPAALVAPGPPRRFTRARGVGGCAGACPAARV